MSSMMNTRSARKLILAGVAALAFGAGTMATTAPAEAFGGHGGGFGGGGAMFHPPMGGGIGHGLAGSGVAGRGGFRGGRGGYGLAGLGLGLAAGGLIGGYYGSGYAYNDGYGAYDGCVRTVQTPYGYRTVNVCN